MDIGIVILGVGLWLVAIYVLFRAQFLILLNRLAMLEFHFANNVGIKHQTITNDTKPWSWQKAWLNSFLHPNDDTWNRLLFQNNISLLKAYAWVAITSLLYPLASSIVAWVKSPQLITPANVLVSAKNLVLVGALEPILFIVITGTIHILIKLLHSKGNYQNFLIVFASSYAPIIVLRSLFSLVGWSFSSKAWINAGLILESYFMFFVLTNIIKFNYRIKWIVAFLVNIAVNTISFFVVYRIYCATGFGL